MKNFDSLNLTEVLLESLKAMNFYSPTQIQVETIPVALQGHDILGSSQTGTGKTIAYSVPLVEFLLKNIDKSALILVPTRELAQQVFGTLRQLLNSISIRSVLLIGGESMMMQLRQLKNNPRLIIGTPGRINDHLSQKSLKLDNTGFLVLDEIDRMLDMGFIVQLDQIKTYLSYSPQTLMFSATLTPNIVKVAQKYLKSPIRISVGSSTSPMEKIKQKLIRTSELEKYDILLDQLNDSQGSFIVFVKTKYNSEKLAKSLRDSGHRAEAIHGDLRQRNRERVIKSFRGSKIRILVATDIAARGLDIPHIEYVINYDIPQCPEDYVHRIGRTGRAGAEGVAISFLTRQDNSKWNNICKLITNKDSKADNFKTKNYYENDFNKNLSGQKSRYKNNKYNLGQSKIKNNSTAA